MQQTGNSHPDAPQRFDPSALTDVQGVLADGLGVLRRSLVGWIVLYAAVIIGSIGAAFLISAGLTLTGRAFQFILPGLFLFGALRISALADGYRPIDTQGDVPWAAVWLAGAAGAVSLSLYLVYVAAAPPRDLPDITLGLFVLTVVQLQASIALVVLSGVALVWPGVGILILPLAVMLRRHPADLVPPGPPQPVFISRIVPALVLLWLGMSVAMLGPVVVLVIPVIISVIQVAARRAFWGQTPA